MQIAYRLCTTNEDFTAIKKLETQVWQMPEAEAITTHTLHVLKYIGGIVMGAFDDGQMIGMAVSFPTQAKGQLWSHMAAVLPEYQGQGIGYQIKQAQRDIAVKMGYSHMHWTFDPAMRGNAHFNFHLLGAYANIYHENFYGMMSDGINAGVPSDRFEAIWDLTQATAEKEPIPSNVSFLLASDNLTPIISAQASDTYHAVQCPYDYRALKAQSLNLAIEWRYKMREVLSSAFEQGYRVIDFVTNHDMKQCWYVLKK